MSIQKQNKELVEKIRQKLQSYIGISVTIQFGDITFDTTIEDIVLPRLADLNNAPEKRPTGDKFYTPGVVIFKCSEGNNLNFVLEDFVDIRLSIDAALIIMPTVKVTIKKCK